MKRELNKWQFIFRHEPDYIRMYDQARRDVDIAVVKFTSFPPEGSLIEKANYKGIWLKFSYWFPIRLR